MWRPRSDRTGSTPRTPLVRNASSAAASSSTSSGAPRPRCRPRARPRSPVRAQRPGGCARPWAASRAGRRRRRTSSSASPRAPAALDQRGAARAPARRRRPPAGAGRPTCGRRSSPRPRRRRGPSPWSWSGNTSAGSTAALRTLAAPPGRTSTRSRPSSSVGGGLGHQLARLGRQGLVRRASRTLASRRARWSSSATGSPPAHQHRREDAGGWIGCRGALAVLGHWQYIGISMSLRHDRIRSPLSRPARRSPRAAAQGHRAPALAALLERRGDRAQEGPRRHHRVRARTCCA